MPNPLQGRRRANPYQPVELPVDTKRTSKGTSGRRGKRYLIATVCSLAGGVTSSVVAATICYLAITLPANRLLQLGGVFGGILFVGVVGFGGFFGGMASILVALSHGETTERAVWPVVLAIPVAGITLFLLDSKISDAVIVLMLGIGVASGMYVSRRICCLLS